MAFGFKRQSEVGLKGEQLFLEKYHGGKLNKIDYKSPIGDFLDSTGKIIELKTDTYPLTRTPNFFMERYSHLEKQTLGGPWRAYAHGADILIYLFASSGTYYCFEDLGKLVLRLEEIIKDNNLKPDRIPNYGYITTGYKIERNLLKDLFTIHTWEDTK